MYWWRNNLIHLTFIQSIEEKLWLLQRAYEQVFLQSLIKGSHCSHIWSKHSQTVIFSLFAPEIENPQHYHQRPSLLKPNLCIFITFSICAESLGSGGAMYIYTLRFLPSIDLLWALFVSLSSNQQTGCLHFTSMPWAKVTFSLLWHSLLRLGPLILNQSGFSVAPLTLITGCCLV